ncbi:MAG: RagB/SusD family nutrient uptake outer membrane protein [Cyclobacteriaceae bacterium]|nr:RagB/SusD family nutrient uptake outer membrane protein [Cyclobacteriaceae bacterium]
MNRIFQISLLSLLLVMVSCIGDLDVTPIDPNLVTSKTVYDSPAAFKQGLAKLYALFILTGQQGPAGQPDVAGVDEGFSCFTRSMWNLEELTTDEAIWSYPNDANGTISNLYFNTWLPSDGIPTALFGRLLASMVIINEYIRATSGQTDPEVIRFQAEARFLRALGYYYGMNLYGNMPVVTENDLPGAFLPAQRTRAEIFEYVEEELLAIYETLGTPRFEYGRADKAAASMLLAKLYLNAAVFLAPTIPPQYAGRNFYNDVIIELNKVIESGYALSPKYINNFLADNHTSPEIIFSFNNDGLRSQAYDGVWIMIRGNSGNGGWGGLRTRSSFVSLFDSNPADYRGIFAKEDQGQQRDITEPNNSSHGYGVFKFRNVNSDGTTPVNDNTGFIDTDYPLFRLADAYLMYAEAVRRGATNGSLSTAVTYVNSLRNRPGDTPIGNVTEGQLTLDFIIDERGRELYWEGHRRTDLIRFNRFTGATYIWEWKGGEPEGRAIPPHLSIFPIPSADLATNPTLKQNPGY